MLPRNDGHSCNCLVSSGKRVLASPLSVLVPPGVLPISIGNRMNVSVFRDLWARVMFESLQICKSIQNAMSDHKHQICTRSSRDFIFRTKSLRDATWHALGTHYLKHFSMVYIMLAP